MTSLMKKLSATNLTTGTAIRPLSLNQNRVKKVSQCKVSRKGYWTKSPNSREISTFYCKGNW